MSTTNERFSRRDRALTIVTAIVGLGATALAVYAASILFSL